MTNHPRKKRRWPLGLLIVALLLAAFIWSQFNWIDVEAAEFTSASLPASFDGFRIVQISDLHGFSFGSGNERLLTTVAAQGPDLIAITGDMVDLKTDLDILPPLLAGLCRIAPTYFVTGNHEWTLRDDLSALLDLIESFGVTVLANEYQLLELNGGHIALCGVHDPNGRADQKTPQQLLSEVPEEYFTLLLAHRNERQEDYAGYDLTLVGHAHGGLIRLPFTDGLVDTQQNWFPSFTNGFYEIEHGTMFVSRGLGNTPRAGIRLFNRPHLPVITLRAAV